MNTTKKQIGYRLSEKTLEYLECGKQQLGFPKTTLIELAVQDYLERKQVRVPCPQAKEQQTA